MSFIVSVDTHVLHERFARMPGVVRQAVERVVRRLAIEVQRTVKDEKLTGQVLHARTGTLRRSINQRVMVGGDEVTATVGTNVSYAAAHEYGFSGEVTVKAHLRRSKVQFAIPKKRRPGKAEGDIQVRSFSRHVELPERSFLRSALREYEVRIREDLTAAVRGAMR